MVDLKNQNIQISISASQTLMSHSKNLLGSKTISPPRKTAENLMPTASAILPPLIHLPLVNPEFLEPPKIPSPSVSPPVTTPNNITKVATARKIKVKMNLSKIYAEIDSSKGRKKWKI
jgi:hypothetical protein